MVGEEELLEIQQSLMIIMNHGKPYQIKAWCIYSLLNPVDQGKVMLGRAWALELVLNTKGNYQNFVACSLQNYQNFVAGLCLGRGDA